MARSAADCGAILGVIAGNDPNDPTAALDPVPNYLAGMKRGLRGLRVGVDAAWNTRQVDATTVEAVTAALRTVRDLGAEIREVTFPDVTQIIADWFPLCSVQTAVAHEATYPARKSEYGPALSSFIDLGSDLSGRDLSENHPSPREFPWTCRDPVPGHRSATGSGAEPHVAYQCTDGGPR
jgi:amidase